MLTRSCLTALMLVFSVLGHLAGVPSVARAAIIGSEAIQRLYLDQAEGQVFIYAGGSFDQNVQAGTFTFFFGAPQWQNHYLTPVLFEETTGGVFVVRGLGTSQTVSGIVAPQSFDFGLKLGTDVTTNDRFTFGFINALLDDTGEIVAKSKGAVDQTFDLGIVPGEGVGGAGSTNRWVFTPTVQDLNVRLGTSFGIPFSPADFALNDPTVNPGNVDRTYSANLSGQAVPEPSTLAMFFGLGGMGLIAASRRRKRTA